MPTYRVWVTDTYEYYKDIEAEDADSAEDAVRMAICEDGAAWRDEHDPTLGVNDFVYHDGELRVEVSPTPVR